MATDNDESQTDDKPVKLRAKPKKVLPTDRVAVTRQLDILRGYAAASGINRKPVSNDEVGRVVNIHPGSVSNCNPFFFDVGLITREKNGNVPSDDAFTFAERSQWSAEGAILKLAPVFKKTWFAVTLLPKLAFRPLSIDQAIEFLAEEAGAGPGYKDQLTALIEYLKLSGIVAVEGTTVTAVKDGIESDSGEGERANLANSEKDEVLLPKTASIKPTVASEELHPFIVGLLKTLPETDTSWPIASRVKWLQTAANIFGLIYINPTPAEDDSLIVTTRSEDKSPRKKTEKELSLPKSGWEWDQPKQNEN